MSRPQWRLYVPLVTPGGSSRERGGAPIPMRERSLRAATSHSRLLGDGHETGTATSRLLSFKNHGEIYAVAVNKCFKALWKVCCLTRLTSYGNLLYDFISTTCSLVLFRPTQTGSSGLNILPSNTRHFVSHGQTHQDTSIASKRETFKEIGQVVRCWFETVLQLVQLSTFTRV